MDSRVDDLILNLNRLSEASSLPKWFVSTCSTYGSSLLWEETMLEHSDDKNIEPKPSTVLAFARPERLLTQN
jgi:hypothetical protein